MLLAELAGVLERPRFRPRLTRDQARAYVRALAEDAEFWPDPPPSAAAGALARPQDEPDDALVEQLRDFHARNPAPGRRIS